MFGYVCRIIDSSVSGSQREEWISSRDSYFVEGKTGDGIFICRSEIGLELFLVR